MPQILEQIELASRTTYRAGGTARYFAETHSRADLLEALAFAKEKNLPFFILGWGSNVLFADGEYPGLVISNLWGTVDWNGTLGRADSGAILPMLVADTAKYGFAGLENLAGIPGTVGGAVRGNAGTPEGTFGDRVTSVEVWADGKIRKITKSKCKFGYRTSRFKKNQEVILSVEFALEKTSADLAKIIQSTLSRRLQKQPTGFSCGSFFQNPENDSAGRLIESCGLKNKKIGGAVVSDKHANWILNDGTATASDILALGRLVRDEVLKQTGIELLPEVEIVGAKF